MKASLRDVIRTQRSNSIEPRVMVARATAAAALIDASSQTLSHRDPTSQRRYTAPSAVAFHDTDTEDPREDVGVDVVECGLNTANSHRPTRDTCSTVESRRVGSCEELNRRQSAGVGTHSKQYYPVCAARHSGVAP